MGPRYCKCIWLISNEAQEHFDTSVGRDLEAQVKGGDIQKLDSVHGCSAAILTLT